MSRFAKFAALATFFVVLSAGGVFGQDPPAASEAAPDPATVPAMQSDIKKVAEMANIAWMLTSAALVLLMMPGLALFYGGMVRRKNLLGTMMHTFVALGIVGVQWVLIGYSLSFGDSIKFGENGYIGWKSDYVMLSPTLAGEKAGEIPVYLHAIFQGMFAIITAALISGAIAERVKFSTYCIFILLWTTIVYDPLAHWVWSADGWLMKLGALDFAGGTVVHIAAGFGGLAATLVLKRRAGYPKAAFHPNGMALTLLGAGMLWFGWFGFNGGSAAASSKQAVNAFTVTQVAAAAAALVWILAEWLLKGKPTGLGFASGIVAGLVAITPAAGFVDPKGALIIGAAAGLVCYGAVLLKGVLGYDDSLDAFGVHGVGGFLGAILTGALVSVVALKGVGVSAGITNDAGEFDMMAQLKVQIIAAAASAAYAFIVTGVLVVVLNLTMGFSLKAEDEAAGLDLSQHGEVGLDYGGASMEEMPHIGEPRKALAPPNGAGSPKRFTVVVDGPEPKTLVKVWSDMCKAGTAPPSAEFKAVYPFVTTVTGNKFRFRGGDPTTLRVALEKLFANNLNGTPVRTYVET